MFKKKYFALVLLTIPILFIVGCGGDSGAAPVPGGNDVVTGEDLFLQTGCKACHSLDESVSIVGPSVAGIGSRAGSMVPGQSTEEYLRLAIVEPDAHLVDGYAASIMPRTYAEALNDQEIDNLVAYLLTLK